MANEVAIAVVLYVLIQWLGNQLSRNSITFRAKCMIKWIWWRNIRGKCSNNSGGTYVIKWQYEFPSSLLGRKYGSIKLSPTTPDQRLTKNVCWCFTSFKAWGFSWAMRSLWKFIIPCLIVEEKLGFCVTICRNH